MPETFPASPSGRVLLVEAHRTLARSLRETLATVSGLSVAAEVASAHDAICAATAGSVDLVIVDVHLPDASGLEVASALRDGGCDAKIILLVEEDDARYHQAAWQLGATACVEKQSVAGELIPAIRQALLPGRASVSSAWNHTAREAS